VKIKMSLKDCWKCQGHVEAQSQYKESKALKMLAIKVKAQEAFFESFENFAPMCKLWV